MAEQVRPGGFCGDEISDLGYLLDLLERPAWQREGACREHPEISWFPEQGDTGIAAKRICQGCFVVKECREWSLAQGSELQGIWGGLDARGRRKLRASNAA
jgi:WhiB family transcriptional regulator, redox-sensing transcriptional regulator